MVVDSMIKLMESAFTASIYGSILVLLILMIKAVLREKLDSKFHYYIWFLLILKLLVPYGPESSLSLFNLIKPAAYERTFSYDYKVQNTNVNISKSEDNKNTEELRDAVYGTGTKVHQLHQRNYYKNILAFIWIFGIAAIILFVMCGMIRVYIIKKTSISRKDDKFNNILEECLIAMNIRKKVKLLYTSKISSPCVYGMMRPVIFIPLNVAESIREDEFKYTILHELAHIKRKDILINWISIILNCVYWFNPIIWYGFHRMKQDCEVSCDALALKYLKSYENIDYGNTIIKIIQLGSKAKPLIGTTSMAMNKNEIKRRIIMVSKYKRVSKKSLLLGACVIVIAGALGLTSSISKVQAVDSKIDNKTIEFKDKNFEDVVRAQIGKTSGNILKSDVSKIEKLDLTYTSIKEARIKNSGGKLTEEEIQKDYHELESIEGLQYFTGLKSLNLTLSFAPDISPLKDLTNLQYLNISRNYRLDDDSINNLSELTNLEQLDISSDGISDLTPLKNLKKLKALNLYSDHIYDLSPIKDLDQLEEINMSGSTRDGFNNVKDISVLKNFKKLKKLDISYNPVDEGSINSLKKVLPNCEIKDMPKYFKGFTAEDTREIRSLGWSGEEKNWSSNYNYNNYKATFDLFNGQESYQVSTGKIPYSLKITSDIKAGTITIKVYNDKKVLFEKDNPANETITISKEDGENVKIQAVGKNSSGSFDFKIK